jgi:capsular polysaccharide transport system ATP-binding protein
MNVAVRPRSGPIITFDEVVKTYGAGNRAKVIMRRGNFDIPGRRAIGLMGGNGAGKSTLLRLIAGTEKPTRGRIRRWGKVSWPLGFAGGFEKSMTARENAVFVARIYHEDPDRVCEYVLEFSELGHYFEMPIQTYSSGMKQKLAFGLCMAMDFDCYLIDEVTAVGDDRFREKCQLAFAERRERSGLIMVSHSFATIRAYCDMAAILVDGELFFFDDLEEGIAEFKCLLFAKERA